MAVMRFKVRWVKNKVTCFNVSFVIIDYNEGVKFNFNHQQCCHACFFKV